MQVYEHVVHVVRTKPNYDSHVWIYTFEIFSRAYYYIRNLSMVHEMLTNIGSTSNNPARNYKDDEENSQ